MHYYGFNVESYVAHTRHLTPLEDIAYRRMLDSYYLHEQPLQGDQAKVARSIGMREHVEDVAAVLEEFFTSTPEGWRNQRADQEIAAYRHKTLIASKAGKASGIARSSEAPPPASTEERPPDGRTTDAERPLNVRSTEHERPFNGRSRSVQPTNPNPNPVPQPQEGGSLSPVPSTPMGTEPVGDAARGGDGASLGEGDGERGQQTLFQMLCATGIRSKAKNRRKILGEWATDLDVQGLTADMFRRLRAKARQESSSNPDGLLATWLDGGSWREKWEEIVGGKVAGMAQRLANARRAQ